MPSTRDILTRRAAFVNIESWKFCVKKRRTVTIHLQALFGKEATYSKIYCVDTKSEASPARGGGSAKPRRKGSVHPSAHFVGSIPGPVWWNSYGQGGASVIPLPSGIHHRTRRGIQTIFRPCRTSHGCKRFCLLSDRRLSGSCP